MDIDGEPSAGGGPERDVRSEKDVRSAPIMTMRLRAPSGMPISASSSSVNKGSASAVTSLSLNTRKYLESLHSASSSCTTAAAAPPKNKEQSA